MDGSLESWATYKLTQMIILGEKKGEKKNNKNLKFSKMKIQNFKEIWSTRIRILVAKLMKKSPEERKLQQSEEGLLTRVCKKKLQKLIKNEKKLL